MSSSTLQTKAKLDFDFLPKDTDDLLIFMKKIYQWNDEYSVDARIKKVNRRRGHRSFSGPTNMKQPQGHPLMDYVVDTKSKKRASSPGEFDWVKEDEGFFFQLLSFYSHVLRTLFDGFTLNAQTNPRKPNFEFSIKHLENLRVLAMNEFKLPSNAILHENTFELPANIPIDSNKESKAIGEELTYESDEDSEVGGVALNKVYDYSEYDCNPPPQPLTDSSILVGDDASSPKQYKEVYKIDYSSKNSLQRAKTIYFTIFRLNSVFSKIRMEDSLEIKTSLGYDKIIDMILYSTHDIVMCLPTNLGIKWHPDVLSWKKRSNTITREMKLSAFIHLCYNVINKLMSQTTNYLTDVVKKSHKNDSLQEMMAAQTSRPIPTKPANSKAKAKVIMATGGTNRSRV